ncbi:MAG: hypothetical protein JKY48_14615 [Flavobacteriales bacterium]|nr:hypothetical protein [Flavobacteriales bacterium]
MKLKIDSTKWIKASILLMLLFTFINAEAQEEWGCSKPSKKALKYYEKAQAINFKGKDAYINLVEAIKEDPSFAEALSVLAYINSKKDQTNIRNANRTKSYHEKARKACASYRNYESSIWLAKFYYAQKDYDQTEPLLIEYISKANPKKTNQLEEATTLKAQIDQYRELFKKYSSI